MHIFIDSPQVYVADTEWICPVRFNYILNGMDGCVNVYLKKTHFWLISEEWSQKHKTMLSYPCNPHL